MSRIIAALVDVAAVTLLGFLAFQLALQIQPCANGGCPLLAPLTIVLTLLALAGYFGLGHLLWRSTPGERIGRR